MRRTRFIILLSSALALAVGCAFIVAASVTGNANDVARRFEVKVASAPPLTPAAAVATQSAVAPTQTAAQPHSPSTPLPERHVAKRVVKPVQTGAIVVRFSANDPTTKAFVARRGGQVMQGSAGRLVASLPTPKGFTPDQFRASLAKRSDVLYAAADEVGRFQPAYVAPTDWLFAGPLGETNWWQYAVKAPSAWQTGFGSATTPLRASASAVKVAVIDTGVYLGHAEMAHVQTGRDEMQSYSMDTDTYTRDNDITPYYDWLDPNGNDSWHGTAVAGTIGAAVNGTGTVGVGYDVIPVGYKIEGPYMSGSHVVGVGMTIEAAIQAIYDATNAGCRVINMSFGGASVPSDTHVALLDAESYAHSHGVIMVAAAGNDDTSTPFYPANDPDVLSVSAVATANPAATAYTAASFSNYGPQIALSAPGQSMVLPIWDPTYRYWYAWLDGTSFAAPTVSGAAAFLWRAAPSLSADQITTLLESSAVDLGAPGRDDQYGHGMIDMDAAYNSLVAQYPPLSKPASISVSVGSDGHSLAATWTPVAGTAVSYAVLLDGTVVGTSSEASFTVTGVASGAHSVGVQPESNYNWWSAASAASADAAVPDSGAIASAVTLSQVSANVTYPAASVSLSGGTNARSSAIAVQSSTDGHTWAPTTVSWTNGIAPAATTRAVGIRRITYFRLALTGAAGWANAYSNVIRVPYYALLKTPGAVSSIRHGSSFTAAETIWAPARVSAGNVTFGFYRWQSVGGKYKWVLKKAVKATSYTKSGNSTTYRVRTALSKAGSYRIYAQFSGGGLYGASKSASRALRVR